MVVFHILMEHAAAVLEDINSSIMFVFNKHHNAYNMTQQQNYVHNVQQDSFLKMVFVLLIQEIFLAQLLNTETVMEYVLMEIYSIVQHMNHLQVCVKVALHHPNLTN